jgi:Hint domain
MSQAQLNLYSVNTPDADTYRVTKTPPVTGNAVIESLSNGDQFVFDGKIYTYLGGADNGGNEVGFIALNAHGKEVVFTTGTLTPKESLTLNQSQSYYICFMPGTLIATPDGAVVVEALSIGDMVMTADGRTAPVRWIGRQTIATAFADRVRSYPIRIKSGALGPNLPSRDLLVSPAHAILLDGLLVQAGALINGSSIVREENVPSSFIYYHVELDDHSLILAEGVPAETFVDNIERAHFDNWIEHERLYPHGRTIVELGYARASSARQVPRSIAQRLAERTQELNNAAQSAA